MTTAATVAAFLGLVVGVVTFSHATESVLAQRLHDDLLADAQAIAEEADGDRSAQLLQAVPPSHLVQVRADDGTIVAASPHYVRQSDDLEDIQLLLDPDVPPPGERWWSGDDDLSRLGDGWRRVSVAATGPPPSTVTVAAPLGDVRAAAATVRRIGTLAVPLFTAMTGLIVWVALGRLFRPVERARAAAATAVDLYPPPRLEATGGGVEIDSLVSTLDDLLQRTAMSARRQRMFFANAAHELLSPLSVLRTNLELSRRRSHNDDVERYLDRCLSGQERLESLARQLLVLARGTELDRLEAADVELASVIDDVVDELATGTPVEVTADLERPAVVTGDPSSLRQLLDNLIANAIRHAHGTVHVTLSSTHDVVTMTVEDDGQGIAAEHREAVFEPFFRVDGSRARSHGGAGLGLTIATAVVAQHGGEVALADSDLGGARFSVTIPRRAIARRSSSTQSAPAPPTVDRPTHGQ